MSQETLERELARRAEDVHGAPFSFEDVRGKAVSIRRRRRAAVTGAVAAVVALALIVPTILTGGDGPGSKAPEPAPPAPGHTAVLHDGTLTLPDGDTVTLDVENADVQQLAVLTDGRIVLSQDTPDVVRVYAPDGTLQDEYDVQSSELATSADDDAVSWIGGERIGDRGVRVLASGVVEPAVLAGIPAAGEYVGFVNAVLDPQRVLVSGDSYTDGVVTPTDFEDLVTSEPLTVTDVNADGSLWAVQFPSKSPDQQDGCAALYDPEADEVVAENCETSFLQFSPDGQHLLGVRGDNTMWGEATVLDLDLEVVGRWESPGGGDVIKSVAWSDSEHLLVSETNWKDSTWSQARVDLTWSDREVVDGPVQGGNPEVVNEYLLSE
jgi:hypothetical protein